MPTETNITIEDRYEKRRGCGYRQPGGIYLTAGLLARACGKLPKALSFCPCCGRGIRPARGWTWINASQIFKSRPCDDSECHPICNLYKPPDKAGLLWIGAAAYPTPQAWLAEATTQGISRRLSVIPRGLELGTTLVLLAHRRVQLTWGTDPVPAIFAAFTPTDMEYVVRDEDRPEQLDILQQRGFRLVRVHPVE